MLDSMHVQSVLVAGHLQMQVINQLIDELADAPVSAVDHVLRNLPSVFYDDVCCITEYELFRRYSRPEMPPLTNYTTNSLLSRTAKIVDGSPDSVRNLSLQKIIADVIAIPVSLGADPAWTAFTKRAESTARAAGFSDTVAAGMAGAIHEMADNIIQHSQAETSGIAGFALAGDRFDYVVGDGGIGMLASLRQAPEQRALRDDLEALPLAVLPGVSRFGRESGRGYGFRAVFLPLKGGFGAVRLRSGSAVLEMTGAAVRADQGRCSQRPPHQGVVVAVRLSPNSG